MKKKSLIVAFALLFLFSSCTGKKEKEEEAAYDLSGKTYYNTVDRYDNSEHSKVWFGKDGSFVLKDNYFDGWYEMSGTWSVKENVCTLEVKETPVGDLNRVLFEIRDDDTLILKTTLAGSSSDDVFSTTEIKGGTAGNGSGNANENGQGKDSEPVTTVKYLNASHSYKNRSYVDLSSDGSFKLADQDDFGVSELLGRYVYKDGIYDLNEFTDASLFVSAVDSIQFRELREGVLILETDLGSCHKGDVFTLDGIMPEDLKKEEKGPYVDHIYIHAPIPDINELYLPVLELFADGSFIFSENVYAGMAQYFGTYDIGQYGYILHVDDASQLQGFAGADVKEIRLDDKDQDTLILKTDLCMSRSGEEFIKAE